MSDVKFSCPNCGQHITADQKYGGCQMICPACSTAVTVPEAASQAPLPAAATAPAAAPAGGSNTLAITLSIIVGAIVIGGGVGAFVAMKRGGNGTPANNQATTPPEPGGSNPLPPVEPSPVSAPSSSTPASSAPKPMAVSSASNNTNPWPQFRGANRDARSTETGLLKRWPAGGPKLLWKATGLGGGYSSVAVAGGKVVTMGDGRGSSQVHAVDENTGRKLWSSPDVGRTGGNYPGTKSTPAIDLAGGKVYALGQFGDFVCVNLANGQEVWRKNLQRDFGGQFSSWNYAESPLLDGDKVMVSPGGGRGAVVALNKADGSTAWQSRQFTDQAQYVSLVIAPMGPRRHYITMSQQNIAGIDAQNGSLIFRIPRAGKTAVIPSPVVYNNIIFVTSGYNVGCNAFQINSQGGRLTTRRLYANRELVNHHGGIVLDDKYVYGHSDRGGWKCMDIINGNVLWENRGVGKGAVVYADGHLICRGESGQGSVALVEATPQGYVEKGRFAQPDRSNKNSWAHPVVANGKLFLRDQDVLLCYDLKG